MKIELVNWYDEEAIKYQLIDKFHNNNKHNNGFHYGVYYYDNEDFLIEDILQRAFIKENLKDEPYKISLDIDKMYALNKGYLNLEVYKEMFSKMRSKRTDKK